MKRTHSRGRNALRPRKREAYNAVLANLGADCNTYSHKEKINFVSGAASVAVARDLPGQGKKISRDDIELALSILEPKEDTEDVPLISSFDSAEEAFGIKYIEHTDDKNFIEHLETQRMSFSKNRESRAPYFPVVQSSGYGKSRMVAALRERQTEYGVIYWTFASKSAFPGKNVEIDKSFERTPRQNLQTAFNNAIANSIEESSNITHETVHIKPMKNPPRDPTTIKWPTNSTIFVVDEASELLGMTTLDGVSYFHCWRNVIKTHYTEYSKRLFFVVMATNSKISQLSPSLAFDSASFKPVRGHGDRDQAPLEPFILGASFQINNVRDEILNLPIGECHKDKNLFSMGRPLWNALLTIEQNPMGPTEVLTYAQKKLVAVTDLMKLPCPWSMAQILALLSVRACLRISPESHYTTELVASHMATAFSVSSDRLSLVVAYPSEPVLAVASKQLIYREPSRLGELIAGMKSIFGYGTVSKGYKGEVIVRLLNLLAMDKVMMGTESQDASHVKEVQLVDFLKMFSRNDAKIDDDFFENLRNSTEIDADREKELLMKVGLWDGYVEDARSDLKKASGSSTAVSESSAKNNVSILLEGCVCFTHFVYLSKHQKDPLITHDLLKYAYRRTAAIVVEEGRRGIDWIIPIHLGDDKFVGLVGQDKNRISDKLETLTDEQNETTHHKINVHYFLTMDELQTFHEAGVDLSIHWPALVFAIGAEEVGVGAARTIQRKRLRSQEGKLETTDFPCIVLVGLSFDELMNENENEILKDLRDHEMVIEDHKKKDIPITYGN